MPAASDPPPPTRWDRTFGGTVSPYVERFGRLLDEGTDVDGEARLADVLAPRGSRLLDAGSGMGRVAAALAVRGHDVTAVEKDPALVEESRRRFPQVPVVAADILELHPERLAAEQRPTSFDLAGHVEAAGLVVQHRFGGYALEPPADDYVVAVLGRPTQS